ncbi:MAG: hypothetical protein AABX01_00035 [Candidatus Micrarchaeota archaeon]
MGGLSRRLVFSFSLILLALALNARADSVFMSCPSVFNQDNTSLSANIYISVAGAAPDASCGNLGPTADKYCIGGAVPAFKVLVNGQTADIESCTCDPVGNPGYWKFNLVTPITQKYNVTAYIVNATLGPVDIVSAEYQCIRDRKSFQGQFTVPEISPLLLPFIIFAALFIMRRARKSR